MQTSTPATAQTQDEDDFDASPKEQAARWAKEFSAAKEEIKKWHRQGEKVVQRFLDERTEEEKDQTRWNLFTADIQTKQAILYGRPPEVDVSRRFADAGDEVGRVASEMLDRVLNFDLEVATDGAAAAYESALQDLLLPGMASVRHRYTAEFDPAETPAEEAVEDSAGPALEVPRVEAGSPPDADATGLEGQASPEQSEGDEPEMAKRPGTENAVTDYVHWKDQLWGAGARVFAEVPWWAFREKLSRKEVTKRFGKQIAGAIPYAKGSKDEESKDEGKPDPWARAEVWEIWSKEDRQVYWYVEGHPEILDQKDDPLELEGFWPFPRPEMANLTTSKFLPKPDYMMVQDLYLEIDDLTARIRMLEKAVKVGGAYDSSAGEQLEQLLDDTKGNTLVPVASWSAFAQNGGLDGAVSWFPLKPVVEALGVLRDVRSELVQALYQLTGMSDIMRGQASSTDATATEQRIKARASGVRMQAMEARFARFVSDSQRIRAEIISRFYDAETIIERSNIRRTPDAPYAEEAAALIKSKFFHFRVQVKPEALAQTDFAALKQERTDVLAAISGFISSAGALAQEVPGSSITLLEVLSWALSGLKGGQEIQGVIDRAIAAAKAQATQTAANPQPPAPEPKLQAQAMKHAGEMEKLDAETKAHAQRAQIDVAAEAQKQEVQTRQNIAEEAARQRIKQQHGGAAPALGPGGPGSGA